jgi:non-ribosomal peptide synthetase component E (peptide arylation enzyme)
MEQRTASLAEQVSAIMPPMTAADFCDRNAAEFGAREALVDARRRLTWREVSKLSDNLALRLVDLGLQRDARVLVQLPNCAELFLTRLACEKAGIRLITVTPAFRRAELAPIIRFTRPDAAIIPKAYRGVDYFELLHAAWTEPLRLIFITGDDVPAGVLSFEEMLAAPAAAKTAEMLKHRRYAVFDICQIATTSGSTGLPKCVEVPLYTRLLTGWVHLQRFGVAAEDRLGAVTSITTGTADALGYNGACEAGAALVLMDQFVPRESCAIMAAERVSVIPLVPTMMSRIVALADLSLYDLGALRLVVNHGSSLPAALGVELETRLSCRVVQAYGSVDCGGIAATHWNEPRDVRLNTVGYPLDGNEVSVVDGAWREVAPGTVGKLVVRGLHTDARFFNNGELNTARRVNGYFDLQELGRIDDQGRIVLVGREHDLIIRGGQNIFPADIEAVLSEHTKVLDVAVVGLPDPEMGERVCAFVVCRDGASLTLNEVRGFLEEKGLARFKWPERIEVLENLPRVASGYKIDKKKIKENFLALPPETVKQKG